ncbi:MAG: hypothetical protein IPJ13_01840 [Saprospiraceae bacterium]|nr:hypothetical protein [Saprospiraceae bacterium]
MKPIKIYDMQNMAGPASSTFLCVKCEKCGSDNHYIGRNKTRQNMGRNIHPFTDSEWLHLYQRLQIYSSRYENQYTRIPNSASHDYERTPAK